MEFETYQSECGFSWSTALVVRLVTVQASRAGTTAGARAGVSGWPHDETACTGIKLDFCLARMVDARFPSTEFTLRGLDVHFQAAVFRLIRHYHKIIKYYKNTVPQLKYP